MSAEMEVQVGFTSKQLDHGAGSSDTHMVPRGQKVPLVGEVGRRLGISGPQEVVPIVLAVLQPLLGGLSLVDGAQLEVALPGRLRPQLRHDHPILGVTFQPPDRFLVQLAEGNAIDVPTAAVWTRAVCAALAAELPPGVLASITAQLPALVRAFFPEGERLAPPPRERAHRCLETPPLWSAIERPVPSYLMFASGDPITGRSTEGVAIANSRASHRVLPQQTHVPTRGPAPLVKELNT